MAGTSEFSSSESDTWRVTAASPRTKCVAIASILERKYCGMPGRIKTLPVRRMGHPFSSPGMFIRHAASGSRHIALWASVSAPPSSSFAKALMRASSSWLCDTGTPNARATALIVTSSCVGPTPPLVTTISCLSDCARISSAISSISSRTIDTLSTGTPTLLSACSAKAELHSSTFPLSTSSPMMTSPALLAFMTLLSALPPV
mmetsp:Transcript_22387/g.55157  ORF Transcript_22387/g.55157 Transcript_22387/m.55157 type:complete len:203 (-) Transcript_22387:14-622(-)